MLNYICSELYRFLHTRAVYITTTVCCALVLGMNIMLHFWGNGAEWYGNTFFSYSMLMGNPFVIVFMGLIVAAVLYETPRKSGALKNSIAFGMNRAQIFLAQCLAGILTATLMLVVILGCYITSAELLLAHTSKWGSWSAIDLITGVGLVYLIACAGLITFLLCAQLFRRDLSAGLGWGVPWIVLPLACKYLGMKFELFASLKDWMPYIFLAEETGYNWWSEPALVEKCLISGVVGVLVFTALGVVSLRKRDL